MPTSMHNRSARTNSIHKIVKSSNMREALHTHPQTADKKAKTLYPATEASCARQRRWPKLEFSNQRVNNQEKMCPQQQMQSSYSNRKFRSLIYQTYREYYMARSTNTKGLAALKKSPKGFWQQEQQKGSTKSQDIPEWAGSTKRNGRVALRMVVEG